MSQQPYVLDATRRELVLRSLQEVVRAATLLAAHVRTNHVHLVASAARKPELVLNALKVTAAAP